VAVIRNKKGEVLLVQNPYGGLFGGLWVLPYLPGDLSTSANAGKAGFVKSIKRMFGDSVEVKNRAGSFVHVLSHRRMNVVLYECETNGRLKPNGDYLARKWSRNGKTKDGALARFTEKALLAVSS
jgi:adenine-specific DNA glycosylase